MTYYALKKKDSFQLLLESGTIETLDAKINAAYYNWAGMQPKGMKVTPKDYMDPYEKVKVTVEKI